MSTISKHIKKKHNIFTPFLLIVLLAVALLVLSLVKHQKIQINQQVIKMEITGQDWTSNPTQFEGYRPPLWLVKNLSVGAKEIGPDGRVVAEIVDIDYFERNSGNSQVFLYIRIQTVDNFGSGRTIFKGKSVEVGQAIEFHFNNTYVVGQVTDIFDVDYKIKTNELVVSGVFNAVPSTVAESIKPGMQILNPYTGEVYAEIESTRIRESVESTIYKNPYTSTINFRTDYNTKDIEIIVRIQTENIFENHYFSGHQVVRLGESLTLFFPEVKVVLEITDVAEVEIITE